MSDRPGDRIYLPLFCGCCGRPVEVTCELPINPDVLPKAEYRCPLCQKLNELGRIPGRVVNVADRPTGR